MEQEEPENLIHLTLGVLKVSLTNYGWKDPNNIQNKVEVNFECIECSNLTETGYAIIELMTRAAALLVPRYQHRDLLTGKMLKRSMSDVQWQGFLARLI